MNCYSVQARPMCALCRRAHSTCICNWVRPQSTAVEVVILQHPLEITETKGTGRLLHLSLSGSRLITGETLNDDTIGFINDPRRRSILLYPEESNYINVSQQRRLEPLSAKPNDLRLIVLDATWRKSRKMLHLNPCLQTLPRLSLDDPPASRYTIRKARHSHQLSTLEATCYALLQLGESSVGLNTLLTSFDGFITQQQSYRSRA